jgi:hypothetical protein
MLVIAPSLACMVGCSRRPGLNFQRPGMACESMGVREPKRVLSMNVSFSNEPME